MQKKCRPKNHEDMWFAMESKWKAIPQRELEALIATMPRRIKDVIAIGGGSTH